MLVCHVSQRPAQRRISADLAEAAVALDGLTVGNLVLATLVDDPAATRESVDAFLGQIIREAASANDICSIASIYSVLVNEAASANDICSVASIYNISLNEATNAATVQDATVPIAHITWDPATITSVTLSGGNLVVTNTGTTSNDQGAKGPISSGKTSGKYYFEVTLTTLPDGTSNNRTVGVGTTSSTYTGMGGSLGITGVIHRVCTASNNIFTNGTNASISVAPAGVGGWIGIAVDLDNRKAWFRTNGSIWNNGSSNDPATNVGGVTVPAGTMIPFCTFGGTFGVSGNVFTANFGASAFAGAVPSGFTAGWPL